MAAVAVAGCESSNNILAGGGAAPQATLAQPQTGTTGMARVEIAPLIGSPESVSQGLQGQLASALQQQQVTVSPTANGQSDYVLRGYIVAAREKAGSKISYIWDVTDRSGQRVHRVTGEEFAPGAGSDPWASVTPTVIQNIASKTASQVAAFLPKSTSSIPMASTTSPATAGTYPQQTAANSGGIPSSLAAAGSQSAAQTTGSIGALGPVTTLVPTVSGAPGDGGVSLTSAIQRELSRNGVALASVASGQTYRVQGQVAMGQARDGKQPIQIDWNVLDPAGKKLGTVSQKNEVPQGSLDGAWGKTADAAAAAAAQGILKLLPPKKATN